MWKKLYQWWLSVASWMASERRKGTPQGMVSATVGELLVAGNAFLMQMKGQSEIPCGAMMCSILSTIYSSLGAHPHAKDETWGIPYGDHEALLKCLDFVSSDSLDDYSRLMDSLILATQNQAKEHLLPFAYLMCFCKAGAFGVFAKKAEALRHGDRPAMHPSSEYFDPANSFSEEREGVVFVTRHWPGDTRTPIDIVHVWLRSCWSPTYGRAIGRITVQHFFTGSTPTESKQISTIVYCVDIVKYSTKNDKQMEKLVITLNEAAARAFGDNKKHITHVIHTGDGFMALVDIELGLQTLDVPNKIACSLAESNSNLQLRQAIHFGLARRVTDSHGDVFFMGDALNDATRVLSGVDKDVTTDGKARVAASKAFCEQFKFEKSTDPCVQGWRSSAVREYTDKHDVVHQFHILSTGHH